jgi:type II secretory pathway pseudopilin PulG
MLTKIKQFIAFTLAEVLIVLGIIGVIAAFIIPTLFSNIQNASYYNQYAENYALFMQASKMIIEEYSGNISGQFTTVDNQVNAFAKYLKTTKICLTTASTECWDNDKKYDLSGNYKLSTWAPNSTSNSALVLANGASAIFLSAYAKQNCDGSYYLKDTNGVTHSECGAILLDVNGDAGPNRRGRDIYTLTLLNTVPLVSRGMPGTWDDVRNEVDMYCNPDTKTDKYNGATCGAKLFLEGKMDY